MQLLYDVKHVRTNLVTALLVVLDVVCEFIENNSDDEKDRDTGPSCHQEPRHVGLSWTGGILLPRWSSFQSAHHYHHYQYWETHQIEDLESGDNTWLSLSLIDGSHQDQDLPPSQIASSSLCLSGNPGIPPDILSISGLAVHQTLSLILK